MCVCDAPPQDVSTKHDTLSFFENRTGINSEMHEELQKRLNQHVHVNVPRFNLLSIKVPNKFENAIIAKVVTVRAGRGSRQLGGSSVVA